MKATEAELLDFLRKSRQLVIPIYQRTYSWTLPECEQLWNDVMRVGNDEHIEVHFIGSIVYIEQGLGQVVKPSALLVIDGQQRLTTVTLMIEALARQVGDDEPVDGFSARKLRNRYLRDPDEVGEASHKLILNETDKATLTELIHKGITPNDPSVRLKDNFAFLMEKVRQLGNNLTPLCAGLAKLTVVDIALNRSQDNPQLIFESMNSTGRELTQADLIRNFILMGLEPEVQKELYDRFWRPMEVAFGQDGYARHFDAFMRYYLTVKQGELPNVRKVYEAFKRHARDPRTGRDAQAIIADVYRYAMYYCAMELGQEDDPALSAAFDDLRDLKANVAYPLLLELYHDYNTKLISASDLEKAVRLVESYVLRRAVCEIPTNSMNRTFESFHLALRKERYMESLRAGFLLMPHHRRFPDDNEFVSALVRRDFYNFKRRVYWLRRLENHDRKERVKVDEYTTEHIMPQNDAMSEAWRTALGKDWQRVHQTWLHTLGNLTLTGYNAEYSDRPFAEKRDMENGFRHSPLRLNSELGQVDEWNEDQIQIRAERLASLAKSIWPAPSLPANTLDRYRENPGDGEAPLSVDAHENLREGSVMFGEVFHAS